MQGPSVVPRATLPSSLPTEGSKRPVTGEHKQGQHILGAFSERQAGKWDWLPVDGGWGSTAPRLFPGLALPQARWRLNALGDCVLGPAHP